MVYIYLAICGAMIIFNIVSAILTKASDKKLYTMDKGFNEYITNELRNFEKNGEVNEENKAYLVKKLNRISNMRAFDLVLDGENLKNPELVKNYLNKLDTVFIELTIRYSQKESMKGAFLAYILTKYNVLQGKPYYPMMDMLYSLLIDQSIYCRENALQAIYSTGDTISVLRALKILDNSNRTHHPKLITDGLVNFQGNVEELNNSLWEALDRFTLPMQITILNYFRFSTGNYCEKFFDLMTDESRNPEIRFTCIRYFGRYRYDMAFPYLLKFADCTSDLRIEYSIIASTALATYPFPESIERLKANLYSSNWYVRFNSSMSLEKYGLTYLDLIDVIQGHDRYASEILRYRFDVRDMIEEERRAGTV